MAHYTSLYQRYAGAVRLSRAYVPARAARCGAGGGGLAGARRGIARHFPGMPEPPAPRPPGTPRWWCWFAPAEDGPEVFWLRRETTLSFSGRLRLPRRAGERGGRTGRGGGRARESRPPGAWRRSTASTATSTTAGSGSGVAAATQECLDATKKIQDSSARSTAEHACNQITTSNANVNTARSKAKQACLTAAAKIPIASLKQAAEAQCNKITAP